MLAFGAQKNEDLVPAHVRRLYTYKRKKIWQLINMDCVSTRESVKSSNRMKASFVESICTNDDDSNVEEL